MFRPKSLFVETKGNIPSQEWMLKVLTGVKLGTLEATEKGIWSDDDISILDPDYVELISGYQKYFVIGSEVEGEVSIDDFSKKYASLTVENFVRGNEVVKQKPQVTKDKLEALTIAKIKEFVKAGSEEFQDVVDLRKKKSEMIDEILIFFGVIDVEMETQEV